MPIDETLLRALAQKQPALAIRLQECEWDLSTVQKPPDAPSIDLTLASFQGSSAWIVSAYDLTSLDTVSSWLALHRMHRLILLFRDLEELASWSSQSEALKLLVNDQSQLICLEDRSKSPRDIQEASWRQIIWNTPGLELAAFDPHNRYSQLVELCLAWSFQRQAAIGEIMQYGAWCWPNILRRLLQLKRDRLLPKSDPFKGIPLLISGAGPSLDLHKESLTTYRDHFLLISAGTAINVLERLKVAPHLAMSVDPFRAQFSRFCLVDQLEQPHAMGWRSNYRALDCLTGPRILLPGSEAYTIVNVWEKELAHKSLENIDEGHNVVAMAMSIGEALGSREIALLGVDLSYSKGSLYGGKVALSERYWQGIASAGDPPLQALGSDGSNVVTLAKWLAEARWIEEFARESEARVDRIGQSGLAIAGITTSNLETLAEHYPQRDYESWLWSWQSELEPAEVESLAIDAVTQTSGRELLIAFIDQLESAKSSLESLRSMQSHYLQEHSVALEKGPRESAMYDPVDFLFELDLEELQQALEALPIYELLIKLWQSCYQRCFACGFESMNGSSEGMNLLKLWLYLQRTEFLIRGLTQLQQSCHSALKGESYEGSEV